MPYKVILRGPKQREHAAEMLVKAPDGYSVTFAEPKRSIEQNDRMWAMLTDVSLARPKGRVETPDTWKFIFMNALGQECAFEIGLDGKPFAIGMSTSKLTVKQMCDLQELIAAFGAENGVVFNEPALTE